MENYKSVLKAMDLLFVKTGVDVWAKWIEKDNMLAEKNIVEHHLRAYGGMGSLNDVVICTILEVGKMIKIKQMSEEDKK